MATYESGPSVQETKLDDYSIKVKDFCLTNGLILLSKSTAQVNSHDASIPLPTTLFPTRFPKSEFNFATALQPHFQKLIFDISNDFQFLKDSLQNVTKVDDFTRRLWNICEKVHHEGVSQPITLSILRNDYMVDLNKADQGLPTCLSQIELNTISCSFGAATSKVAQLHRYALRFTENQHLLENHVENENATGLAQAMVKAWRLYGNKNAKLVFLVSQNEANIGDQRLLEYKCLEIEPNLDIRRYTITDFALHGSLDQQKHLKIEDNEIGLVYFRSCYDPSDFLSEKEWDARLLIERSRAIKCPSIQVHLAGAKIIQQALSEPNALTRFVPDSAVAQQMKATFVDIFSIHDQNLSQIIDLIRSKSEDYVLKPQREGGGNNIYKEDIRKYVENLQDKNELKAFILMKLVRPTIGSNYIIRAGDPVRKQELISELGVFGFYIGDGSSLLENQTTGYLLRTKSSGVNEGGVAAGYSALDSILLS